MGPSEDVGPARLAILGGRAGLLLAAGIARELGVELTGRDIHAFPDGELSVALERALTGQNVFIVEPTAPPVHDALIELLLLADACRRGGAERITAVMPYFGYARQDRRSTGRDPLSVRVIADALGSAGIDAVVAVDLHSTAVEAALPVPLEHLSAVPLLAERIRALVSAAHVVIAPDLGAMKLAERYASLLGLGSAAVYKQRISGQQVEDRAVIGNVRGRIPLIVDDMISTGATAESALRAAWSAGARPAGLVVATHGPLVSTAISRIAALGVERILVTDSVPSSEPLPSCLERVPLAGLLAAAVKRLALEGRPPR